MQARQVVVAGPAGWIAAAGPSRPRTSVPPGLNPDSMRCYYSSQLNMSHYQFSVHDSGRIWVSLISPVAGSVPEPVVNASSLVFPCWADDGEDCQASFNAAVAPEVVFTVCRCGVTTPT